jgi:hypothetical protein
MKKNNLIKKIIIKNIRYLSAFIFLVAVFLINQGFMEDVTAPAICNRNDCLKLIDKPSLSNKSPIYFVNNIFKSNADEYYRLVFQEKSSQDAMIRIKIATPLDEIQEIGSVELKKSDKHNFHELLFSSKGKYSDLVFEKENKNDGADIAIIGAQISKLNISNEKEFSNLVPTTRGSIDFDVIDQQQLEGSYRFPQLSNPKSTFGQIFKSNTDFIIGITLSAEVLAQKNRISDDRYRIELREATFDGGIPEVAGSLSEISFSISDLEKYRQSDENFSFPFFSKVEKGRYYFVGINNIHADVDKFNYLKINGILNSEKYDDGIAAVVINKQAYAVDGQLYFITHGLRFNEYKGIKILAGEVIEYLGEKSGLFTYHSLGNIYDKADIYSHTDGISFHKEKMILFGITNPENPSSFVYKFETIFPFKKMRISGQQADINWEQVKMSYSYDQVTWKEIPSITKSDVLTTGNKIEEFQNFDYTIYETSLRKKIFIKIESKNNNFSGKSYGLINFKVEADLIMK